MCHALLLSALCLSAVSNSGAAEPLVPNPDRTARPKANEAWKRIIPTPKHAQVVGEDLALPMDATIVVPPASVKCWIGAEEISRRVTELGGKPLTITESTRMPERPPSLTIVVGSMGEDSLMRELVKANRLKLTASRPGKQGYIISFLRANGKRLVLLGGCDPQGALWACVSFTYLLSSKAGKMLVSPTNVTDWPDYKYRGYTSVLFWRSCDVARGAKEVDFYKQRLDWLLRHKINVIGDEEYLPNDMTLPAEPIPWTAETNAYARERGIFPHIYQFTAVAERGREGDLKERLQSTCCLFGNFYFTWSDEELLWRRAMALARFVKANNFTIVALHPPDGGGPVDPECWSQRSPADKKRWRDDQRAEADAFVFNTFYRALKSLCPEAQPAYTVYSYVASYIDFDLQKKAWPTLTREQWEMNVVRYWHRFAELIPEDVHIVVWNDFPKYMDEFRRIFGKRPMYYYCELAGMWHRHPYFAAVHRYVGTNFHPEREEDWLMAGHDRIRPNLVNMLCGVEFAWNTKAPGAASFTGRYWDMFKDDREPEVVFKGFIPRACYDIWGDEAAPLMAPLFQSGLNPALLVCPDFVIGYENGCRRWEGRPEVRVTAEMMEQQLNAARKALPGLEEVVRRRPPMDDFAFRCAVYYYRRVRVLEAIAEAKYHILKASELSAEGKVREALRVAEEGSTKLDAALPLLKTMAEETDKLPHLKSDFHPKEDIYAVFYNGDVGRFDLSQLRRALLSTVNRAKAMSMSVEPVEHKGSIRTAVYCGALDGGQTIGHDSLIMTFREMKDVEAEYTTDLTLPNLCRYEVLVFPQGTLGNSASEFDFFEGLRRYVSEAGGGVWFQHDAVGTDRFQFGSRTVFPEVCRGTLLRVDSSWVRAAKGHPILSGIEDKRFEHSYYDHWTLKSGPKGTVVLVDDGGKPVMVVGEVGKGRVLYDGTILLTPQDDATKPKTPEENAVLRNAVVWLGQRR